jgi:hypothetical protein
MDFELIFWAVAGIASIALFLGMLIFGSDDPYGDCR